eukprot:4578279-Amphidinium_carterae.1
MEATKLPTLCDTHCLPSNVQCTLSLQHAKCSGVRSRLFEQTLRNRCSVNRTVQTALKGGSTRRAPARGFCSATVLGRETDC